jgi:LysM repeat protein
MNNPSPLIPQGSLLEQKNKSRARFKIAVFFVLAFHGVGLLALLLMPGCGHDQSSTSLPEPTNPPAPSTFSEPSNPPAFTEPVPTAAPSNPVVTEPTAPTSPVTTPTTPTTPVTTPTTPTVPSTAQEHTIVKGDSFATLAKKYGVSAKDIAAANPGVDSSKLKIGKTLHIPAPRAATTPVAPTTTSAGVAAPVADPSSGGQVYTVKSGDMLSKIASQHGTTAKALRAANNLKTDRITVGQKLKIPGKAAPTTSAPEPVTPPAPPTGAAPAR